MRKPVLLIVTPALADANNGNWQTARRWARLLAGDYEVRLAKQWQGEPADVLVALHARRSAASVKAWAAATPRRPLVVVLTGTDLYRDIATDPEARHSLALADRLVVLHERAPDDLPAEHRHKAVVCFQSCGARRPVARSPRLLRALMVGHLRPEKDPATYFAAARKLVHRDDIRFDHVGNALDEGLASQARGLMAEQANYRWLGGLPHEATLRRIQRAHVLVHPSLMEGGAHVVMEAVRCGTPVLASRIPGNVGLLGEDYRGYFAPGDAAALAVLLQRCRASAQDMLQGLRAQCDQRSALFEPSRERATLARLLASILQEPR